MYITFKWFYIRREIRIWVSCLVHDILGETITNFCHLGNTEKITLDIIERKNEIKSYKKISSNPEKYSKVIAINTNRTRG